MPGIDEEQPKNIYERRNQDALKYGLNQREFGSIPRDRLGFPKLRKMDGSSSNQTEELGGNQWRDPWVLRKRKRTQKKAERKAQRAQKRSEQRGSNPTSSAGLREMTRNAPKLEIKAKTPQTKALKKRLLILFLGTGIVTAFTLAGQDIAKKAVDRAEQNPPSPLSNPNFNEAGNQTLESMPVNQLVTVFNTGNEGLILRSGPGKNNEMVGSAFDGDTLVIVGEAVTADGYVWYPVQFPFSENETPLWAAGDWLTR